MSRASIVQIDTDATNGPSGEGPKIARLNAAQITVPTTVAATSRQPCETIFASTNALLETGLVSVRIAVPELRSPDTAPAPVITTAISTI
jgi:hypothetical protein